MLFDDIEIEKHKFYHYKSPIFLEYVDINKVLVSNKISFNEKNLYDDYRITPLHIMLPKMSAYVKSYVVKLNRYIF